MKKLTTKKQSIAAVAKIDDSIGGFDVGSLPKATKTAKVTTKASIKKPAAGKGKKAAKKPVKKSAKKKSTGNSLALLDKEFGYSAKAEAGTPAKLGAFYKAGGRSNVYKPAWDKPRQAEKSLDELFKRPVASKKASKVGGWLSKKIAKPVAAPETAAIKTKKPGGWLVALLKILVVLILLVVLLVAFDVLGIYRLGFKDDLSLRLAQTLNLPAGQVNGQTIAVADYFDDLKLLAAPLSQKREGLIDYSSKTDLKDQVFYRLAANELVKAKLRDYKQEVAVTEIDSQVKLLVQQAGDVGQAEAMIKGVYGLDLKQFENKILEPMIAREKLQLAIMNDDKLALNVEAKKTAGEILQQALATTSDFTALAKKYTQDEAGVNTGGELGWVTKGQLDTDWDKLIFSSSSTPVLPQLVKSRFGYHILKVEQRLTDSSTGKESVKLRHILIKVDIDQYIKSLLDASTLVKYVQ
jgi:parvulin-like peptidyl-prolyl isomerase